GGVGHDRLRATEESRGPGGGFVLRGEVERTGMSMPTTQRLLGSLMMTTGRVQKSRGARPPIEVLVGTPHGEVDIAARQIHRYRTRTVAQVPHHQCTVLVRQSGDRGHVPQGSTAVVHVAE